MTEKQYRLNKWGTRLLKNNRPLFNWVNESEEIVDLLNKLYKENEQLKKENKDIQDEYDKQLCLYNGLSCEYDWLKGENEQLKKRLKMNLYGEI